MSEYEKKQILIKEFEFLKEKIFIYSDLIRSRMACPGYFFFSRKEVKQEFKQDTNDMIKKLANMENRINEIKKELGWNY